MIRGIDISNWQNGIELSYLDIDFCIFKATEGIGYTDPTANDHHDQCIDNGLLWGFYHFARENEPEDEAEWFYNECKGYIGNGIPVLDYETQNHNDVEWCERFVWHFHELSGIWCMLYLAAYYNPGVANFEDSWLSDKCALWLAGYPFTITDFSDAGVPCSAYYNPSPWDYASIWQFTSELIIPGYHAKLDGNIAYMDSTAWMKIATSDGEIEPIEPVQPTKSTDDLVLEVLLGEYGNGEDRKRLLGDRYDEVQSRLNELYGIAEEVIEGKWGNGWNRMNALNGAGYPYDIVQRIVNALLE